MEGQEEEDKPRGDIVETRHFVFPRLALVVVFLFGLCIFSVSLWVSLCFSCLELTCSFFLGEGGRTQRGLCGLPRRQNLNHCTFFFGINYESELL